MTTKQLTYPTFNSQGQTCVDFVSKKIPSCNPTSVFSSALCMDGTLRATSFQPTNDECRTKSRFGVVTDWIDDYKTRKSGYGPPYYVEYGGDLPGDCNRMGADLG